MAFNLTEYIILTIIDKVNFLKKPQKAKKQTHNQKTNPEQTVLGES